MSYFKHLPCAFSVLSLALLFSACGSTPDSYKGPPSIADTIFSNLKAGSIVSNCVSFETTGQKVAEIVCLNMLNQEQPLLTIRDILEGAGWTKPEDYMIANASKRLPSGVSDEGFFTLKQDGPHGCIWFRVIVFIDEIEQDSYGNLISRISLNKYYDACEVLV